MFLNSRSSLIQLARIFSDLLVILKWILVFCSQTASRRRKRVEAFLHSDNPDVDSDSWLSTTNLVRDYEKEERRFVPIFSLLIFPKFSHQLSMRRGVGIVGGGTFSVLLVCILDGVWPQL